MLLDCWILIFKIFKINVKKELLVYLITIKSAMKTFQTQLCSWTITILKSLTLLYTKTNQIFYNNFVKAVKMLIKHF